MFIVGFPLMMFQAAAMEATRKKKIQSNVLSLTVVLNFYSVFQDCILGGTEIPFSCFEWISAWSNSSMPGPALVPASTTLL